MVAQINRERATSRSPTTTTDPPPEGCYAQPGKQQCARFGYGCEAPRDRVWFVTGGRTALGTVAVVANPELVIGGRYIGEPQVLDIVDRADGLGNKWRVGVLTIRAAIQVQTQVGHAESAVGSPHRRADVSIPVERDGQVPSRTGVQLVEVGQV